ncbi:MAG TPA: hypothetical protein VFE34_11685 [Dongiaceae bacterium]|jgi:hypothetical protein|nr:hypothetical protein [Dongiaceae bacterium]
MVPVGAVPRRAVLIGEEHSLPVIAALDHMLRLINGQEDGGAIVGKMGQRVRVDLAHELDRVRGILKKSTDPILQTVARSQ